MSKKKCYDRKHLTTTQRIKIEKGMNDGLSFAAIARAIDKHPSTIAKEVKKYRFFPPRNNPDTPLRCALFKDNPGISVVEMDTVEGGRSNSKQVLLTMLFQKLFLMLVFVLEEKTQDHVIEVFDLLSEKLGVETFNELFPVILTDNGVEFQFPTRLECDKDGKKRTSIYYCNPNSSWQKGMIEKNHEYIRYVIPKGSSLDLYSHKHASLLMNHINSEARDSLNGCTPFRLSKFLLNNDLHRLLRLHEIPADEVSLKPSLLKK